MIFPEIRYAIVYNKCGHLRNEKINTQKKNQPMKLIDELKCQIIETHTLKLIHPIVFWHLFIFPLYYSLDLQWSIHINSIDPVNFPLLFSHQKVFQFQKFAHFTNKPKKRKRISSGYFTLVGWIAGEQTLTEWTEVAKSIG